jgi:para-nitrobenzyl esterase
VLEHLGLGPGDLKKLIDNPTVAYVEPTGAVSAPLGIEAGLSFAPTVDGTSLPVAPLEAVAAGAAAGVTLVTGWNAEEMRLFGAMDPRLSGADEGRVRDLAGRLLPKGTDVDGAIATYRAGLPADATPGQVLEAMMTDSMFRIPALRLLEAQAAHAPVRAYEFRYRSPGFGAAHAVEIPFVFDNLDAPGAAFFAGEASEEMRALAASMADDWAAIATSGSPTSDWPTFDADRRATRTWDLESGVEDDPGRETRLLWG